jgi:hypothetical protein
MIRVEVRVQLRPDARGRDQRRNEQKRQDAVHAIQVYETVVSASKTGRYLLAARVTPRDFIRGPFSVVSAWDTDATGALNFRRHRARTAELMSQSTSQNGPLATSN